MKGVGSYISSHEQAPKDELIRELRAQLLRFDRSPDFGDGETVHVIGSYL